MLAIRTNRINGLDVQREFDNVLNQWFNGPVTPTKPGYHPVDVKEDGDHYYVEIELAGVRKEDVAVTIEDQTLTITAGGPAEEAPQTEEAPKVQFLLRERRPTQFQRSFTLPHTVGGQDVNARMDNGVLTVTLKKREEIKPRKISVQ